MPAAFSQKSKARLKSVIVTEEKHDAMIKKEMKESETYYDTHGNIVEEITYKQGKIKKHFKYQYNDEDQKIREEEYEPTGKIKEHSEYKYENGLRVEKLIFDAQNKLKNRKVYQYTTY